MKKIKMMKYNRVLFALVALGALTSVFVGCNKDSGSRDGLVKASGTVTYKGEPVADAVIEMRPIDQSTTNSVATGRTDEKGKFTLMTDRPGDGAVPGKYRAVVKKEAEMIDGMTREEYVKANDKEGNGEFTFDKSKLKVEQLLPVKYADPLNSPLEVEVPAGGSKEIALTLED